MRRWKITKDIFGVLVAVVLLASSIAIPTSQAIGEKYGGTFVVHLPDDPMNFNPYLAADTPSGSVYGQVYDSLFKVDKDFNIIPCLAESYEVSADGLTYTFHLRHGVKWHDGVEFTSKDVKFSFETVINEKLGKGYSMLKMIESIETPDIHTVIIKLQFPWPLFVDQLVGTALYGTQVLPEHLYNVAVPITDNPHNYEPIGTGAFKFVEWVKGDRVTLVANKEYFLEGPYLDELIFKIIPDSVTAAFAMEKGEIHYSYYLPIPEIPRFLELPETDVHIQRGTRICYFGVQTQHPTSPVADKRVRQAIYTAIDRKSIKEHIVPYFGIATSFVSSALESYYNPEVAEFYPLSGDVEEANRILDEAGYARGTDGIRFSVEIILRSGEVEAEDTAAFVSEIFEELGIKLSIRIVDYPTFIAFGRTHAFELILWRSDNAAPPIFRTRFHSDQLTAWNIANYNNSRVDYLIDAALGELDREKAVEMWWEVQEIIMEELPWLPIWEEAYIHVFNREFKGLPSLPRLFMYPFNKVYWELATPKPAPPYELYAGAIVIIVIVAAAAYWYRKRKA